MAIALTVGSVAVMSACMMEPAMAASKHSAPSVKSKLLSVSDMPTGWSISHTSGSSGGVAANSCLSGLQKVPKHGSRASVAFTQGSGIPAFFEELATGKGEAAKYKLVVKRLKHCKSFALTSGGKTMRATVGQMSFPHVGRASDAFSMSFTVTHVAVGLDLVLFRVGSYVGFTAYADLGTPTVTTLVSLTQKAVGKAGGSTSVAPSGASKGPTTATVAATLVGNATPSLKTGPTGQLDVVFVGSPTGTSHNSVPVEVWNGTSGTVNNVDVSGSAVVNGAIVGSGDSQDVKPKNLQPGQVAFGMVYFQTAVPSGATFNLSATGSSGTSTYYLDARVTQANFVPAHTTLTLTTVSGGVANPSATTMTSPISVSVFCFTGGVLSSVDSGFMSGSSDLAPQATGSFSVTVPSTCTSYLVGASGYGKL